MCYYDIRKDSSDRSAVPRSSTGLKRSRDALKPPSGNASSVSALVAFPSASGQSGDRTNTRDVFKTFTTIQDRVGNPSGSSGPSVEISTSDTTNGRVAVHGQTALYTLTSDGDPMRVGFQQANPLNTFANKL